MKRTVDSGRERTGQVRACLYHAPRGGATRRIDWRSTGGQSTGGRGIAGPGPGPRGGSPLNHPELYYGFAGIALAWQGVFLILGRDPGRHRIMMIPAMREKGRTAPGAGGGGG